MLNLTAFNSKQGGSSSLMFVQDELDVVTFFEKSQYSKGEIFEDGELVGTWDQVDGFTWFGPKDPFGNELVEEMVVSLDRTAVQLPDRAMLRPVVVETTEKIDWSALTEAEARKIILEKLKTNNEWLRRAVVAIYNRQTSDEQVSGETKHNNGMGFNGLDSGIMTNIANRIIAKRRSLSEKELAACRRIMPKYVGQLVRIAKGK